MPMRRSGWRSSVPLHDQVGARERGRGVQEHGVDHRDAVVAVGRVPAVGERRAAGRRRGTPARCRGRRTTPTRGRGRDATAGGRRRARARSSPSSRPAAASDAELGVEPVEVGRATRARPAAAAASPATTAHQRFHAAHVGEQRRPVAAQPALPQQPVVREQHRLVDAHRAQARRPGRRGPSGRGGGRRRSARAAARPAAPGPCRSPIASVSPGRLHLGEPEPLAAPREPRVARPRRRRSRAHRPDRPDRRTRTTACGTRRGVDRHRSRSWHPPGRAQGRPAAACASRTRAALVERNAFELASPSA